MLDKHPHSMSGESVRCEGGEGGLARGGWGKRALFTGRGTRSNYLHVKIELYFYILYITGSMNLLGHGMRKHF